MAKSIIWADSDKCVSFSDYSFIRELDVEKLINVNLCRKFGEPERDICEFFTVNTETIRLREELFAELLGNPELFERLDKSFSVLDDFFELQKEKENAPSNEQLLFGIKELETYVEYLKEMKSIFTEYIVNSKALKSLWEMIYPICSDERFGILCEEVDNQIHTISRIKSITVGVNLDAQMRPTEAGVVAVHEQNYVSGEFINKLLRLDFKNNEFVCSAPLLPIDRRLSNEELGAVRISVNSAMNKVFASALKSWSGVVRKYVVDNLQCLASIVSEWKFIVACMQPLKKLKDSGFSLCIPAFDENDHAEGLYHPILALSASSRADIIKNEISFNKDERIYILTGPNQGGKSIFTQSVGLMYVMLHLGLLIPASRANIHTVDAILVHFIDVRNRSYVHGRLSDECEKIHKINNAITAKSIFLFDEALSSTNASEAVAISAEIISAYCEIGVKGIWTTHFHELCRMSDEYTGKRNGICNISAQIDEESHTRVYKIVRGDGGQSYAMDIARKYGLSKDEILANKK